MPKSNKPLAKIIALDIGGKRTGIAETDFLQMVASPLETIATPELTDHLQKMMNYEAFESIIVGDPIGLDGGDSDNSERVRKIVKSLKQKFPSVNVETMDERFSSKLAMNAMIAGGMKKMQRRKKGEIDKVSAAIILQSYLEKKGTGL